MKTAFITGGASGLGLAMAHAFGGAGMNVMLADIEEAPLAAAVAEFDPDQIVIATEPPEQSIWHRFDVVDRARSDYHIPVTNVIAMAPSEEPVA